MVCVWERRSHLFQVFDALLTPERRKAMLQVCKQQRTRQYTCTQQHVHSVHASCVRSQPTRQNSESPLLLRSNSLTCPCCACCAVLQIDTTGQITMENLVDSNVFIRSVALSFERFRLDSRSVYRRPDVLAHRREEQAAALLACDEQGLSAEFVVAGSASGGGAAKSSDASAAAAVALVAADRWLTHDEDVLAEVPQRTRRLATNHLAAVVSLGCLLRLHMVCMV
eukprot:COSAG06_NODE_14008_length_1198_cov_0.914468_1_plen_225_part_00